MKMDVSVAGSLLEECIGLVSFLVIAVLVNQLVSQALPLSLSWG